MNKVVWLALALLLPLLTPLARGEEPAGKKAREYDDPARLENEVRRFEEGDSVGLPPAGAIVCTGSSSMKGWHATIREDLAPLPVIPRGFGGSTMNDLLYYADRLVVVYRPRAVVVYEGDNDIGLGIPPEKVAATFKAFVEKVHAKLPETRIYVLSIKPSISRWDLWKNMQAANALIKAECDKDKLLTYVDVAASMLDQSGQPRKDLYQKDNLHLVRKGYEIWRDAVRPALLAGEQKQEKKAEAAKPEPPARP
jgi:lysophospholipase L1-like esterase